MPQIAPPPCPHPTHSRSCGLRQHSQLRIRRCGCSMPFRSDPGGQLAAEAEEFAAAAEAAAAKAQLQCAACGDDVGPFDLNGVLSYCFHSCHGKGMAVDRIASANAGASVSSATIVGIGTPTGWTPRGWARGDGAGCGIALRNRPAAVVAARKRPAAAHAAAAARKRPASAVADRHLRHPSMR